MSPAIRKLQNRSLLQSWGIHRNLHYIEVADSTSPFHWFHCSEVTPTVSTRKNTQEYLMAWTKAQLINSLSRCSETLMKNKIHLFPDLCSYWFISLLHYFSYSNNVSLLLMPLVYVPYFTVLSPSFSVFHLAMKWNWLEQWYSQSQETEPVILFSFTFLPAGMQRHEGKKSESD